MQEQRRSARACACATRRGARSRSFACCSCALPRARSARPRLAARRRAAAACAAAAGRGLTSWLRQLTSAAPPSSATRASPSEPHKHATKSALSQPSSIPAAFKRGGASAHARCRWCCAQTRHRAELAKRSGSSTCRRCGSFAGGARVPLAHAGAAGVRRRGRAAALLPRGVGAAHRRCFASAESRSVTRRSAAATTPLRSSGARLRSARGVRCPARAGDVAWWGPNFARS